MFTEKIYPPFDGELTDDYLFSLVEDRIASDKSIVKMKRRHVMIGDKMEKINMLARLEYDTEVTMYVGAYEEQEPQYRIEPDYTGIADIMSWVDDWGAGKREKFPDDPVLEPIIPKDMYEKTSETTTMIENKLIGMMGAIVLDPSYRQFTKMEAQNFRMCKQERDDEGDDVPVRVVNLAQEPVGPVYYKTNVSKKDLRTKQKIVGQQFNPFHPMSARFIVEMEQKGLKVEGSYQMRNRRRKFFYNLDQNVYRVHSDRWLVNLDIPSSAIMPEHIVYDIVSNFDIRPFFRMNKKYGIPYELPPIIVMPLHEAKDSPRRKTRKKRNKEVIEVGAKWRARWEPDAFYSKVTNIIRDGRVPVPHIVGDMGNYVLPYASDKYVYKPSQIRIVKIIPTELEWEGSFVKYRGGVIPLDNRGFPMDPKYFRRGDQFYELSSVGMECHESLIMYADAPRNSYSSLVQEMLTLSLADYVRMIHLKTRQEYPFLYAFRHYFFDSPLLEYDDAEFLGDNYDIEPFEDV